MQEMYKLTRENNRMLHSMRRNAFWGGILKFIVYAAFLLAPIWFYYAYLDASVQSLIKTMNQIQGTGSSAQVQLSNFSEMIKQFEEKLKSAPTAPKQ